jgi:uncharacterized YigZ family protein
MDVCNAKYFSIEQPADAETVIQRSRFIASLRVVKNRAEFEFQLGEVEKLYPKATHYCWAYRFAASQTIEHSSDSGEPSGSAGRPILGALKKYSLLNVMAVVTRYYGGVKLGIRGLITAYTNSTIAAIERSTIIVTEPQSQIYFKCSYEHYNTLLAYIERLSIKTSAIRAEFTDEISGEIIVPNSSLKSLSDAFDSIAPGRGSFSYSVESI